MAFFFINKSTTYIAPTNSNAGYTDKRGVQDKLATKAFENALSAGLGFIADIAIAIATAGTSLVANATKWSAQAASLIIKETGKSLVKQVAKNAIAGGVKGVIRAVPIAASNFARKTLQGQPLEGLKSAAVIFGSAGLTGALGGALKGDVFFRKTTAAKQPFDVKVPFYKLKLTKLGRLIGDYGNQTKPGPIAAKNFVRRANAGGSSDFQNYINSLFNSDKYYKRVFAKYYKRAISNARIDESNIIAKFSGKKLQIGKKQRIFSFLDKYSTNIIDDILIKTASAPSLSSLAGSLKNTFNKLVKLFIKGKISKTTFFKKFKSFQTKYKNYVNTLFLKADKVLKIEVRIAKLKQTFKWEQVKAKFDSHFKKQHAELLDKYKKFRAGAAVDAKKLENDMDNLVLQSQKAIPLDIKVGSQWILGYKWIVKTNEANTGSLRVFFKSRISKRASKILKKGKRKGTRIYAKPVKDAITFGLVPQDLFDAFQSSPSPGSFYYNYFADKRLKGGGREAGWQPRSRASIAFLIDKDNTNITDTYGLQIKGASKSLITKSLNYNKTTSIAFKYTNKASTIKQAIKNPASIATRAAAPLKQRLSL